MMTTRRRGVSGVRALLAAMLLAGCGGDPDPSVGPEPTASTTSVTPSEAVTSPLKRNGQITGAERYLGTAAHGSYLRAVDAVAGIGLFAIPSKSGPDAAGFEVVGRTGPIATFTCARGQRCPSEDDGLRVMTLGPGADEVTVGYFDRAVQVIGYDGRVHRTFDLTAAIPGDEDVESLRWSPDGSRLAVVTWASHDGGGGNSRVWVVNRDGGDPQLGYAPRKRRIEIGSNWGWSPDGQTLLLDVIVGHWDSYGAEGVYGSDVVLLHMQPDGAADPVIAQTLYHANRESLSAGNLAWSPDGTRIAVRTRRHITEISADDGSVIAQHPPLAGWLIWPAK